MNLDPSKVKGRGFKCHRVHVRARILGLFLELKLMRGKRESVS